MILKDIFYKNKATHYVIAGGCAFALEYSLFNLLFYVFAQNIIIANSASFLLGLLTSFILNKNFVFKSVAHNAAGQFIKYCLLAGFNLLVSGLLIKLLINLGIPPFIAKGLVIGMIAVWNYSIFNKLIFKK